MSKLTLLIDRDSIKKNPNAGQTHVDYVMHPIITYWKTQKYIDVSKIDNLDFYSDDSTEEYRYTYISMSERNFSEIRDFFLRELGSCGCLLSERKCNIQRIQLLSPMSDYLYNYNKNVIVKCEDCNNIFSFSELVDDYYDYNYDYVTFFRCPKCDNIIFYEEDITYEKFCPEMIEEIK